MKQVYFYESVLEFEQKFFNSGEYFRQGCQNFIPRVQSIISRKKVFFEKKIYTLIAFGLRAKNFRTCDENYSAEISKLQSTCPQEQFEEKHFFEFF